MTEEQSVGYQEGYQDGWNAAVEAQQPAPVQEPDHTAVHLAHCNQGEWDGVCKYSDRDCPALSAQQPRKAVKLTDEELSTVLGFREYITESTRTTLTIVARAIEQAVLKKNGVTE